MKKVVYLFLVLTVLLTFVSCSNREIEVDPQEWGSFSPNKTLSIAPCLKQYSPVVYTL